MNKRIKKLWIKALRSGKYEQGKKLLRVSNGDDRFCCLGVLCEVYRKDTGDGSWNEHNKAWFETSNGADDSELPFAVQEWAELGDPNPVLGIASNSASASKLNDRGETFEYIADRIEKYL